MHNHPPVLITYATRMESTSDVAEVIGMILHEQDVSADVMPVDEVETIDKYEAVILGSAIRGMSWLPEAVNFIAANVDTLSRMPVAYFTVCMTMREDTADNRKTVMGYMQPVLKNYPQVDPISIGLFGGMLNKQDFPRVVRWLINNLNLPSGDYRDWEAIHHWTKELLPYLVTPDANAS